MSRIHRFLTQTPFLRWVFVVLLVAMLTWKFVNWSKRYVAEVLVPRAEAYVYEKVLPRVLDQARKSLEDGIRQGANGALHDATGGLLGNVPAPKPLTVEPGAGLTGIDPCRTAPTEWPGFLPRLGDNGGRR